MIDFIRDFKPSNWGWSLADLIIFVGIVVLTLVSINWILSFLKPRPASLVKKMINVLTNCLFFGLLIIMVLNAILTKDYRNILMSIFVLVALKLNYWSSYVYKLYDNFIDKKINKD
jgi:hypothetical protein